MKTSICCNDRKRNFRRSQDCGDIHGVVLRRCRIVGRLISLEVITIKQNTQLTFTERSSFMQAAIHLTYCETPVAYIYINVHTLSSLARYQPFLRIY